MRNLITYITLAILLSSLATAIGIGPAQTRIDFEPNLTGGNVITIYNTENQNFDILISKRGEFANLITVSNKTIKFDQEKTSFNFEINLPREYEPGVHSSEINILANPPNTGSTISTSLGLTHKITLVVPAHGKYVKESFEVINNTLYTKIKNIGLKTVENMDVISTISDANNEIINNYNKNNFQADDIYEIRFDLTQLNPGFYEHKITINYDDLTKEASHYLEYGEFQVRLVELLVKEYSENLLPVDVVLESNWNEEKRIFVEFLLKENEETIIREIRSAEFQILGTKTTTIFLDTENLERKEYNLDINIYQEDKLISSETILVEITDDGITLLKDIIILRNIIIGLIILVVGLLIYETIIYIRQKRKI